MEERLRIHERKMPPAPSSAVVLGFSRPRQAARRIARPVKEA
jgi:hypothetical protein